MKRTVVEILLTNQDFINWVKNPNRESNLYWKKWIEENPEYEADLLEARKFINEIKFTEPISLSDTDSSIYGGFDTVLSNILRDRKSRTSERLQASQKSYKTMKLLLPIAAAVAFLIILSQSLFDREIDAATSEPEVITKVAPFGQKLRIKLPDQTFVVLNSGSEIRFLSEFVGETRDVHLNGEAFFEVTESAEHPFRVFTRTWLVEAVGTSFNVRDFEDEKMREVALSTGKVIVTAKSDANILSETLVPGEIASYDLQSGELSKLEFDPNKKLAWKDGILLFDKASLNDFKIRIERWYGVNVNFSGRVSNEPKVSGYFKNETLENVLYSLKYTTGIDFLIEGENITLILNQ